MGCAAAAPKVIETEVEDASFQKNYDVREQLGVGSFGRVCVCVHKKTHAHKAVKILQTSQPKQLSKATKEQEVWEKLGTHENIVALLESYMDTDDVCHFVMQRCRCSIFEMFKMKGSNFSHGDILDTFQHVLAGLQHCHSVDVVHRDMKASNLLVDLEGVVKIADFGLSCAMTKGGITGIVGSVPYMSAEMVKGKVYGFKTDLWSVGAVVYFLVYGEYPYEGAGEAGPERKKQMMKAIATNTPQPKYTRANRNTEPSPHMRQFIERLLERKVDKRPNAEVALNSIVALKVKIDNEGCDGFVHSDSLDNHKECTSATTKSTRSLAMPSTLEYKESDSMDLSFGGASGATESTTAVSMGGSSLPVSLAGSSWRVSNKQFWGGCSPSVRNGASRVSFADVGTQPHRIEL